MTGDVVVVTPVRRGHADDLREHLLGLGPKTGPLHGELGRRTHFARFVVLPIDDGHQLFFSSRFDGEKGEYLKAVAASPAAQQIWLHCEERAGDPLYLHLYLEGHSRPIPYVLAVWTDQTVAEVNEAVRRRAAFADFASRAAGLDPVGLAHAFRAEFG